MCDHRHPDYVVMAFAVTFITSRNLLSYFLITHITAVTVKLPRNRHINVVLLQLSLYNQPSLTWFYRDTSAVTVTLPPSCITDPTLTEVFSLPNKFTVYPLPTRLLPVLHTITADSLGNNANTNSVVVSTAVLQ